MLWAIDPGRHGEGLTGEGAAAVLELAGELELDEVFVMIMPNNLASRRVADKLALERIGNVEHADLDFLYRFRPG